MKVAKYISGQTPNNIYQIVEKYYLVENDYDFQLNNAIDVTSFNTLTAFFSAQRINYLIYRKSLIDNILPNFNSLNLDTQKGLLYNRIFPSGLTTSDIIEIVGSKQDFDTINRTNSEFEMIFDLSGKIQNLDDKKIDKVSGSTKNNLTILNSNGTIKDSGISIERITGGTRFYYYKDESVIQSTSSLSNIVYINGISLPLKEGMWSIDFNAVGGNNSKNKGIVVGFYIDNVLQGVEQKFTTNNTNDRISFDVTKDLELSAGQHTFQVRFRANQGTAVLEYGAVRAKLVN